MKYSLFILLILFCRLGHAQQLDSIFFNLYTDSLKKGTYNYINVEGKYSNGTYLPLGEKELKFSASSGKFHGNSLFVDSATDVKKITVKVFAIKNPRLTDEIVIYIKQHESDERLPTVDEVLKGTKPEKQRSKKRRL